jgi:Tol biopolymer transport system component
MFALGGPAYAAFPGANGKIAFTSTRTGNYDIYTMNPDGSDVTALTNDAANDLLPAWSADGQKIVFESDRGGGSGIWLMNSDGNGLRQVTAAANSGYPAWSPNGNRIAFSQEGNIWTVDADGTNYNQVEASFCDDVTGHCTYFSLPTWSPNGKTIDYVGAECCDYDISELGTTVQSDIWSIPATGGSHADVTNTPNVFETAPDWSPDGSKLAIESAPRFKNSQIWTMSPDGANRIQLTDDPVTAGGPAWSPDGARIAFDSYRDGNYEVYVMNADGSGQTNLTHNSATDFEPDWQPLPGPKRSDYKNAAQFCKAELAFLGDAAFAQKFGGGANAQGKCVSQNQ